MLTPNEMSRPAPSVPAAMIPGPAPVTTIHPCVGERLGQLAGLRVERVVGMRAGRPEDRDLRDVAVAARTSRNAARISLARRS